MFTFEAVASDSLITIYDHEACLEQTNNWKLHTMLYFPFFWILSVIANVLFFLKFRWIEKKYNITIERHSNAKFPVLKRVRSTIKTTNDKNLKKDLKLMLFSLYVSYTLVFVPIIIYFVIGIFFTS
jgi:hypothetical protein